MPNDVINTVTINGTQYNIGGSGGHTIKNPAGTAMTQRSNLQFVDLTVSDDSTNDATKVENIHVIQSESELDNLPDGLYMLDEDEGTVIDGSAVGYDNTDSGLDAENVQDAIDEVVDALDDKIDISAKGVANGVAELDSTGKVPSSQLPSFVDDVIEVADYDHLPATGETGKIYVALDTNKTYRWGGTEYVEISESLALGETSSTAYRGDRGKAAYDHSQLTSGNPHNVTKSDIGLGNVDNTSDSTKKTNFTGSIASSNTGFVTGGDVYTALGGKADKVSGATDGHIAGLDANGNLTDSGLAATTIVHKADKVSGQVAGHLASLSGTGNLTDSGWNGAKDTTSISGNPISISGLKANQLAINPIITLEPIQAGSGTPSPSNIRAISGYDKVEVLSCGVNVWDEVWELGELNAQGQNASSTTKIRSKNYIPVVGGSTYYLKLSSASAQVYICFYDVNKTFISSSTPYQGTFTVPLMAKYCRFNCPATYGTTYNNDMGINYPATQTSYVASNKTTDLSESLGQTVYFASDDVRAGDLSNLGDAVDLGSLTWDYRGGVGAGIFSTNIEPKYLKSAVDDAICEMYNNGGGAGGVSILVDKPTGTFCFYIGATNDYILYIKDTNYTDATTFKNAITGKKVVFKKETINHIQHTPHEISLLKDYAYVSTNGTNIALDYHNGELASLADVAQVGESLNAIGDYIIRESETLTINLANYDSAISGYLYLIKKDNVVTINLYDVKITTDKTFSAVIPLTYSPTSSRTRVRGTIIQGGTVKAAMFYLLETGDIKLTGAELNQYYYGTVTFLRY